MVLMMLIDGLDEAIMVGESQEQIQKYISLRDYLQSADVLLDLLRKEPANPHYINCFHHNLDMMRTEDDIGKRLANAYLAVYIRLVNQTQG